MSDYLDMIDLGSLPQEDRFPAWRAVMLRNSKDAKTAELHCWNQEQEWIDLALQYGEDTNAKWDTGKIIKAEVTEALIKMLTTLPKPEETEIYDKMTPFFSIFFDNGFSSEHYGTQLWMWVEGPDDDEE